MIKCARVCVSVCVCAVAYSKSRTFSGSSNGIARSL